MAATELPTSARQDDRVWRGKYRDLCRELDTAKADWADQERTYRQALLKFLQGVDTNAEVAAPLRELRAALRADRPVDRALLARAAELSPEPASGASEPAREPWAALLELLDTLNLPVEYGFELQQLRGRCQPGGDRHGWLVRCAALLNDVAVSHHADPCPTLLALLDLLPTPAPLAPQSEVLRDALAARRLTEPVEETARYLKLLQAFLRQTPLTVSEYLGDARRHLAAVEGGLRTALHDSRAAAARAEREATALDAELAELAGTVEPANTVNSLLPVATRLRALRGAFADYRAAERAQRHAYEDRIAELAAQVVAIADESARLRETLLAEHQKAYRDPLTQLPNRLAYDERLQLEWARAGRRQGDLSLAVFDIDHFKRINDTLGHPVGDQVLRHVAALWLRRVRETDLLARIGGEEFALLLPDTALATAQKVCEELRAQLARVAFQFQGQPVPVSVSVGLTARAAGDTADGCFARADRALYSAKAQGRNRLVVAVD
jgi:diguanylate cyclase (GGDEF)-like protein